ncbi:hypothetical protein LguiB_015812 [Lonicera macranthoides]
MNKIEGGKDSYKRRSSHRGKLSLRNPRFLILQLYYSEQKGKGGDCLPLSQPFSSNDYCSSFCRRYLHNDDNAKLLSKKSSGDKESLFPYTPLGYKPQNKVLVYIKIPVTSITKEHEMEWKMKELISAGFDWDLPGQIPAVAKTSCDQRLAIVLLPGVRRDVRSEISRGVRKLPEDPHPKKVLEIP